ncbi:unnamed protein product [Hymenolepis diminuta]|uniref:Uncharacterized protein n=1 Tax=Hymenolepis diminuta TaxID=6216 RepID=A0A0R3SP85_HYMDI|nr:unnamed protein product [Hymenolepis diminuta]
MDNPNQKHSRQHGHWPQLSQLLDNVDLSPPTQQFSLLQGPSTTNATSSTSQRHLMSEPLLNKPDSTSLPGIVTCAREHAPRSPNTAQRRAEEDAERYRYTNEFISRNRALEDPNYLGQRLNEMNPRRHGNSRTNARVQQWVAENYPTNALPLITPQATFQPPFMQQNAAPMTMAQYYLQNLYLINSYFQRAMINYSMGNVSMHPQPTENPISQMRNAVPVNVGASTSRAVFGRPGASNQLIQLDQTQNVHLAGPPSTGKSPSICK